MNRLTSTAMFCAVALSTLWSALWSTCARAGAVAPEDLPLRPAHDPPPPSWWPPAPGWWLVAAVVLVVFGLIAWWRWRRLQFRRRCERIFQTRLAAAKTPAAEIAAMSELLRRAARRREPAAVAFAGEAWLRVVEGGRRGPHFDEAQRSLLLEGGFRPQVAAGDAAALRAPVLRRYLQLMGAVR